MTETFKVKMKKPEREFVKVYKDFLRNQVLTAEEKIIYISLKYFVEYGKDEGEVYPSMETLCKLSSLSKPRATRTISSLIKKGVVKKTRRGLNKTNEYTLMDNCLMWASDTEEKLKELASTEITFSTEELLEELQRRGAIEIVKEKVPETSEPTKVPEASSTNKNNIIKPDYKINESNCQEVQSVVERYPLLFSPKDMQRALRQLKNSWRTLKYLLYLFYHMHLFPFTSFYDTHNGTIHFISTLFSKPSRHFLSILTFSKVTFR